MLNKWSIALVVFVAACTATEDPVAEVLPSPAPDPTVDSATADIKKDLVSSAQAVDPYAKVVHHNGSPHYHIDWDFLAQVKFTEEYIEEENAKFWIPQMPDEVLAMQGQNVALSGYLLPLEPEENFYVLSANPNAACFFCGAAGPESVVKLQVVTTNSEFYMDNYLTFCGKLKLNPDNLWEMNFILENAELIPNED